MTSTTGTLGVIQRIAAALVAALAAAATAHAATVLVFFVATGASAENLAQLSAVFQVSSLVLFLLLAFVTFADILRRWYVALPVATAVAVIAALLGATNGVVAAGSPLDAGAVAFIFGTLVGHNLVFVVAAVLATMTLARRVWAALTGGRLDVPRIRDRKVALVRLPATNLDEGIVTHIARSFVDTDLADQQWDAYVAALEQNGWEIVEVPVAPEAADSVFVEDTVVMFGDLAVITNPGADTRRDETVAVEETVHQLGLRTARITAPGTLDGGDVLKVGTTVYVGRGDRTNAEGIRQLRSLVTHLGYTVVAVPVSKVLHLKSAVTALPDGTVIGFRPHVDDPNIFDRFLPVPEESGAAVIELDATTVLMAASAPRTAALIADLGYEVITVDISEFEKLEGCVTCLSVRIR